jgi:hypothetical protein
MKFLLEYCFGRVIILFYSKDIFDYFDFTICQTKKPTFFNSQLN